MTPDVTREPTGGQELREVVARFIFGLATPDRFWDNPSFEDVRAADCDLADQLLALPEVAALIADGDRVRRVRELADVLERAAELTRTMRLDRHYHAARGDGLAQAVKELRRALDGEDPT